jgi:hypothetical protein
MTKDRNLSASESTTMETVSGEWWELDLVISWEIEVDDCCVTLTRPDGVGALQLSGYQKRDKTCVDRNDLLLASKVPPDRHPFLAEQDWGEFHGFQLVYAENETFWRRWWLANGTTFLFITYNCPKADMETELDPVNSMLGSLRVK